MIATTSMSSTSVKPRDLSPTTGAAFVVCALAGVVGDAHADALEERYLPEWRRFFRVLPPWNTSRRTCDEGCGSN
jgi:hypothetical protein